MVSVHLGFLKSTYFYIREDDSFRVQIKIFLIIYNKTLEEYYYKY